MPGPIIPIQEKTLRFDMTIMALMLGDGEFTVERQYGGKCPGALRPIFTAHKKMDEEMGLKLIKWIGGQDAITPAQRALSLAAAAVAEKGVEPFRDYWKALTPDQRAYLKPSLENFQSIAAAADAEAERIRQGEKENDTDLSEPFGGKPALPGGVQHAAPAVQGNDAQWLATLESELSTCAAEDHVHAIRDRADVKAALGKAPEAIKAKINELFKNALDHFNKPAPAANWVEEEEDDGWPGPDTRKAAA